MRRGNYMFAILHSLLVISVPERYWQITGSSKTIEIIKRPKNKLQRKTKTATFFTLAKRYWQEKHSSDGVFEGGTE